MTTIRMVQGKAVVKNRVYECMTRVQVGQFTVRVWSEVDEFAVGPDKRIVEALTLLPARSALEIGRELDTFDGIAAYEILDANGNGALVYPDWR